MWQAYVVFTDCERRGCRAQGYTWGVSPGPTRSTGARSGASGNLVLADVPRPSDLPVVVHDAPAVGLVVVEPDEQLRSRFGDLLVRVTLVTDRWVAHALLVEVDGLHQAAPGEDHLLADELFVGRLRDARDALELALRDHDCTDDDWAGHVHLSSSPLPILWVTVN